MTWIISIKEYYNTKFWLSVTEEGEDESNVESDCEDDMAETEVICKINETNVIMTYHDFLSFSAIGHEWKKDSKP